MPQCTGRHTYHNQCRIRRQPSFYEVNLLVCFFLHLFPEKGLNPRMIKGYRSVISATLSGCGSRKEFSESPELDALMRSFKLEKPPKRKIVSHWNLLLVLKALLKSPFEPLQKLGLKHLTLKTIFLVALASGRRRSELHALCFDSDHFRQNQNQTLVTLYPALDFIANNQILDAVNDPVKLKAFTSVGWGREGSLIGKKYVLSELCSTIER